jgi:hypothetical protein
MYNWGHSTGNMGTGCYLGLRRSKHRWLVTCPGMAHDGSGGRTCRDELSKAEPMIFFLFWSHKSIYSSSVESQGPQPTKRHRVFEGKINGHCSGKCTSEINENHPNNSAHNNGIIYVSSAHHYCDRLVPRLKWTRRSYLDSVLDVLHMHKILMR